MNEDRLRKSPNVGIIGSSSLLGKELKEQIEEGGFPLGKLILLETEEYAGLLQEFAGDIQITQIISPEVLADVDIAFFTCGPEIMQSYLASGTSFPELTIDLTQSGRNGTLFLSGLSDPGRLGARGYFINPHPATIVIARTLSRMHQAFGLRSAAVTIMEPASSRGNSGVDELQQQTVNLLNFQGVEVKVFRGQLSFNVLPESGISSATEDRIVQQFSDLMGETFPRPLIYAVQAPVFYSHAFSMFVRFLQEPSDEEVRKALASDSAFVVHSAEDEPSPVNVVGTHGIHVGRVRVSADQPGAFGLWLVADNLRLAASNAIRTAENIMLTVIGR
jgi:aspartate-semialdehyde dehydrogenase